MKHLSFYFKLYVFHVFKFVFISIKYSLLMDKYWNKKVDMLDAAVTMQVKSTQYNTVTQGLIALKKNNFNRGLI